MSNHYSAAYLRFPGDDARLDFTDLYIFQSPGDAAKTVMIMDVNPYATGISVMPPFLVRSQFHPAGVYRINVDSNGDLEADADGAFHGFKWTGQDAFANRNIRDARPGPGDRSLGDGQRAPRRCPTSCATTGASPLTIPTAAR